MSCSKNAIKVKLTKTPSISNRNPFIHVANILEIAIIFHYITSFLFEMVQSW